MVVLITATSFPWAAGLSLFSPGLAVSFFSACANPMEIEAIPTAINVTIRFMQSEISLNPLGIQPPNEIERSKLFEVIHEDEHLLVVNKPAGLVCHPTKGDEYSSLISRVRLYLGPDSHPHMVNRLDRETSGVVIIGKTQAAALA